MLIDHHIVKMIISMNKGITIIQSIDFSNGFRICRKHFQEVFIRDGFICTTLQ